MATTRTFVAVFPPREVVGQIAGALEAIRRPGDGIAWIREANLHYTLRFLGDLEPARVDAARDAARAAAASQARFALTLGEAGAFPDLRRPRVLWIGASAGGERMSALAAALERALVARDFPPADKPFAPHLTIGRVREGSRIDGWPGAATFPAATFEVGELAVIASTLAPGGSRYDPLERAPLAPAG